MRLEKKHTLPTRIFHWINGPSLVIMIWSGVLIYWADDTRADGYRIGFGSWTLFHFFPEALYKNRFWRLDHHLARGLWWHFTFAWFFALNGLAFVAYTLTSGEWRYLVPRRRSLLEAWQVVLHDLGIRKQALPRRKFNDAQRIAYSGVLLMGAGSLVTGLAIYKPTTLSWLTTLLGGYRAARAEHFTLTIGCVLFFFVHISQVIRAGWNNFRAMVIGVEVADDEEPTYPETLQRELEADRVGSRR